MATDTLPDFYRGDTYSLIRVAVPGVDITGWIFTMTFKALLTDATPSLQIQQVASGAEAVAGTIALSINSEQTASLAVGRYFVDIEVRVPGSPDYVETILFQKIRCLQDVTA